MSQFDSLLDFGDSSEKQQSNDFDPFEVSPTIEMKGGGTGSDLLGDFSFGGQTSIQTNGTHNDTDLLGFNSSNNVNPLYELQNSSDKSSPVNPLYNMEAEFSTEPQKQEVTSSASANPLYDFMSNDGTNGHEDTSMDLMGTSTTMSSEDSGVTMDAGVTMDIAVNSESSQIELMQEEEVKASEETVVETTDNNVNEQEEEESVDVSNDQQQESTDIADQQQESTDVADQQYEPNDNAEDQQETPDVAEEQQQSADQTTNDEQEDSSTEQMVSAANDICMNGDSGEVMQNDDKQGEVNQVVQDDNVQMKNNVEQEQERDQNVSVEAEQQQDAPEQVDNSTEEASESQDIPKQEEVQQEPAVTEDISIESQEDVTSEDKIPEETEIVSENISNDVPSEEVDGTQEETENVTEEKNEEESSESQVQSVNGEQLPEQNQVEEGIATTTEESMQEQPSVDDQMKEEVVESNFEEQQPNEDQVATQDAVEDEATQEEVVEVPSEPEPSEPVPCEPVPCEAVPSEPQEEQEAEEEQAKTEVKSPTKEEPANQQQQNTSVVQNGVEKEDVHFDEMSSIKNKFESSKSTVVTSNVNVQEEIVNTQAGEFENQPEQFEQWQNKAEGGVFENQPQSNEEIVKEDRKIHAEELPEQGLVRNIFNKFKQIQEEGPSQNFKKELSPPDRSAKYEYVSEPRSTFEMPKEKVEAGVFESQPEDPEDVVRAGDVVEDVLPEKGSAQNVLAKFKHFESQVGDRPPPSPGMRELTPDRNTKGEYVSEPRAVMPRYEAKVESGTFESQPQEYEDVVKSGQHAEEVVPERGTALSLVSRFTEIESQSKSQPAPHMKKELTPDRNTKGEYVSEPRGYVETYEGKAESGVFESQPQDEPDIVKSGDFTPEPLPEAGYARNVAAKFREIEKSGGSSPSGTPQRFKEVTPPREDTGKGMVAGVLESTPQDLPGVVKSSDERVFEEELPERGTAKNLLNRFKEIQSSQSPTSRQKKEFTPPPESNFGVYENTPAQSLQVDIRPSESGILESTPMLREDVARETQSTEGETAFPESGFAKNMVTKWRQIESDSGKATPSPKYKEFTPPRDRNLMSPKSPAGVNSSVQPNDLPGQYHEQSSAGVFENSPEHREGVAREADTDFAEGLPARDTTKSLLQRFKSIQDTAKEAEKRPEPINRKEFDRQSEGMEDTVGEEPKMFDSAADDSKQVTSAQNTGSKRCSFMPTLEKCEACQKTVYAMEKLEYNKSIFHRSCFRCSKCNSMLTPKTFSCNSGTLFCTTHYKQLFTRKGNYDEGFGRQQHKKKWGQGTETQVEQSANGH